ncbi:CPBP family intramembrane glutamic endopeptidase [Paratractidigestivibacter sp.]|uniref:CPBP family intramembrane glutamic endopeptidase n=1 Tax=Paratractidigestivibacter sp. TaxID=2847316 RepID=UPI002ABE3240|nr:CPBP family intramembrane glutamic endopeptidase [Paratractidigestivibacter sp.]
MSKLRVTHPFLYAVVIFLIFGFTMQLASLVATMVFTVAFGNEPIVESASTLFGEIAAGLVLCAVLRGAGRGCLLTKKGRGFVPGLAIGGYCFVFFAFVACEEIVELMSAGAFSINLAPASAVCVLSMLAVGVTEEIEARALIGETFLEHFGTTRDGALRAAVASGLIFGLMHITNAIDAPFWDTVSQVILCFTGGILYGVIYFRGGNLWSIALIHGLNDVFASLDTWLVNGGASPAMVDTGFSAIALAVTLLVGALDIAVSLYLLRKDRAGEVAKTWPEISESGGWATGEPAAALDAAPERPEGL